MQLWVIQVSIDLAKIWKHRGIDHRSTTVKGDSCGHCLHVNQRNITVFELDIGISLGIPFVQKFIYSITNNTSITNFNLFIIQGIKLKNISSYVPSNEDVLSLSSFQPTVATVLRLFIDSTKISLPWSRSTPIES